MTRSAILFSAIDDPAPYWEQDHAAMNRLLLAHDRLVGQAVSEAGGRVLAQRDDGVLALLPLDQALACAQRIRREAASLNASPFAAFTLSLALDRGAAEQASVVEALALRLQGGGLALSQAMKDAVSLPAGAQLEALGSFELPGLGPLSAHRLREPGSAESRLRPAPLQAQPQASARRPLAPELHAAALSAVALTRDAERALHEGDPASALRWAAQAQPIWQEIHDAAGEAMALRCMAQAGLQQGSLEQARQRSDAALALARASGDAEAELRALALAAEVAFALGDVDGSRAACYRSLALGRQGGIAWAQAEACLQLALLAELQGFHREARHYLGRAQGLLGSLDRKHGLRFSLRNLLAQVEISLGHYPAAEALLEAALDPREWPEDLSATDWPRNLLAQLCVLRGDYARAQALCERGLATCSGDGSWYKENLAAALYAQGQTARAMELGLQALHSAEGSGRLRGVAWGNNRLARFEIAAGRYSQARERLLRARELHEQLGEPQGLASDDLNLARLERLQGDPVQAAALAERVASAYLRYSMPQGLALAQIELGSCFLSQGELGLALEPVAVALRQSAAIGAWPTYFRALRRLAEIRAREGQVAPALAALSVAAAHPACDAELKESIRGLMMTLGGGKAVPLETPPNVTEAARDLGIPIPYPAPETAQD